MEGSTRESELGAELAGLMERSDELLLELQERRERIQAVLVELETMPKQVVEPKRLPRVN